MSLPDPDTPPPPSSRSAYTNFRQADVAKFSELTEVAFADKAPPVSAAQGAATFQRILNFAAKWSIPSGRLIDFIPGINPDIAALRVERDALSNSNPQDPDIDYLSREIYSHT